MGATPPLKEVDAGEFDRVWKIALEVGQFERHFNTLQMSYRTLASTWLLAAFGAAGLIITKSDVRLPFSQLYVGTLVGIAGAVGIVLLWVLDILVYNQLLDACFDVGYRLEKTYKWLPPARMKMKRTQGDRGVSPRVVWFYVAGVASMFVLAASTCILGVHHDHPTVPLWVLILVGCIWFVLIVAVGSGLRAYSCTMRMRARVMEALEERPLDGPTLLKEVGIGQEDPPLIAWLVQNGIVRHDRILLRLRDDGLIKKMQDSKYYLNRPA
jgi:hypothetical protein